MGGIVSNRSENAFGVGFSLTNEFAFGQTTIANRPVRWSVKALAVADGEIAEGGLVPGVVRWVEPDGSVLYYREAAFPHDAIPPSLAEEPAGTRGNLGLYGLVDVWRVRLGAGVAHHTQFGTKPSLLLGFAATSASWIMIERPNVNFGNPSLKEWRLRIEMRLCGPFHTW